MAEHLRIVTDDDDEPRIIPIRPTLGNAGVALAGWTIRILPVGPNVTDAEYDAALVALDDYDVEGQIDGVLADLRKAPALRNFRVVFD